MTAAGCPLAATSSPSAASVGCAGGEDGEVAGPPTIDALPNGGDEYLRTPPPAWLMAMNCFLGDGFPRIMLPSMVRSSHCFSSPSFLPLNSIFQGLSNWGFFVRDLDEFRFK